MTITIDLWSIGIGGAVGAFVFGTCFLRALHDFERAAGYMIAGAIAGPVLGLAAMFVAAAL